MLHMGVDLARYLHEDRIDTCLEAALERTISAMLGANTAASALGIRLFLFLTRYCSTARLTFTASCCRSAWSIRSAI